jgi:hypothetical protein
MSGMLLDSRWWSLVTGRWFLVTGYWFLDTGLLDARYSILVTGHWPLVTCHWLLELNGLNASQLPSLSASQLFRLPHSDFRIPTSAFFITQPSLSFRIPHSHFRILYNSTASIHQKIYGWLWEMGSCRAAED